MPAAAIQDSINPIALAIDSGYTFVARANALADRRAIVAVDPGELDELNRVAAIRALPLISLGSQ